MGVTEVALSDLDLFGEKAVQYSILKVNEIHLRPLSSIEQASMITFADSGYSDDFRNLSSCYIAVKVKMTYYKDPVVGKEDEILSNLTSSNIPAAPVNNLIHSLFKQVIVKLNGIQIQHNNVNYMYRSYFENLCNFDSESAGIHLSGSVCWELDTAGSSDNFALNTGQLNRGLQFPHDEEVQLIGRLHLDLFNQPKLLLPKVDLSLTFELNRPEFYLMKRNTANKSKMEITDMDLYMDMVKINPQLSLSIEQMLTRQPATYSYKRVEVRNFQVNSGQNSFSLDNIYNGSLPFLMLIAMVNTNAYQGEYDQNPYNFQHYHITSFTASVNGLELSPRNLSFDYSKTKPKSQRAYFQLFKHLQGHRTDRANQITKERFDRGSFMLCYDLAPTRECTSITEGGTIQLKASFSQALSQNITILIYLQFDSDLLIDRERNIYPQLV